MVRTRMPAATISALELGAVDFFLKPSALNPAGMSTQSDELVLKVKIAAQVDAAKLRRNTRRKRPAPAEKAPANGMTPSQHVSIGKTPRSKIGRYQGKVLVIGSSTGGPKALSELVPELPADLPVPVLIVQHMPAGFTKSLAQRLDQSSKIRVKEAEIGDHLETGTVLLAPGDHHMVITSAGQISLNQDPPVWGVRPSVDVTMNSVADIYGGKTIGVVLTGMGSDGSRGTARIKEKGGMVVVEHESTCTIYGMPRTVVESGNADMALPLPEMAEAIVRMCKA